MRILAAHPGILVTSSSEVIFFGYALIPYSLINPKRSFSIRHKEIKERKRRTAIALAYAAELVISPSSDRLRIITASSAIKSWLGHMSGLGRCVASGESHAILGSSEFFACTCVGT